MDKTETMTTDEYRKLTNKSMTEDELSRAVKEIATKDIRGWLAYHTYRSTYSAFGFPDWVFSGHGRIIMAELKREGKVPAPAQIEWLDSLVNTEAEAYLWYPRDVDEIYLILQGNIAYENCLSRWEVRRYELNS